MLRHIAQEVAVLVEKKDSDYNHAFRKSHDEYDRVAWRM